MKVQRIKINGVDYLYVIGALISKGLLVNLDANEAFAISQEEFEQDLKVLSKKSLFGKDGVSIQNIEVEFD